MIKECTQTTKQFYDKVSQDKEINNNRDSNDDNWQEFEIILKISLLLEEHFNFVKSRKFTPITKNWKQVLWQ
jgi:hypothetical protein